MATYMAGTLKVSNMIWEGGREGQRLRGEHGGPQWHPTPTHGGHAFPERRRQCIAWKITQIIALHGKIGRSLHCPDTWINALHGTRDGTLRCAEKHVGQCMAWRRESLHRTENHVGLCVAWKKTCGSTHCVANPAGPHAAEKPVGPHERRQELCPYSSTELHPTTCSSTPCQPLLAR